MEKLKTELGEVSRGHGGTLFGIADLFRLRDLLGEPPEIASQFPYSISTGVLLSRPVLDTNIEKPSLIYKYHYRHINLRLDAISIIIANRLRERGFQALPLPASQITDWDDISGDASHKAVAYGAGLGFYGRNNLLVNPVYGSQVRYISIFTDAPLPPDEPIEMDCGDCYDCVEICPAKCIGENRDEFDLSLCKDKLREFKKYEVGQYICGVCLRVCDGGKIKE